MRSLWLSAPSPLSLYCVFCITLSGSGPELFWTIVSIVITPSIFVNLISMFMLREDAVRQELRDIQQRQDESVKQKAKAYY